MVCTWHLPVRGKVEKRKHMERASSRSRRASMNVGYLHGRKGSIHRFGYGPPWRPYSPTRPCHYHLLTRKSGSAQGPGSASFPTALGGTMEPEHAHLVLRIRGILTRSPRHPLQTKDSALTHFHTLWSKRAGQVSGSIFVQVETSQQRKSI